MDEERRHIVCLGVRSAGVPDLFYSISELIVTPGRTQLIDQGEIDEDTFFKIVETTEEVIVFIPNQSCGEESVYKLELVCSNRMSAGAMKRITNIDLSNAFYLPKCTSGQDLTGVWLNEFVFIDGFVYSSIGEKLRQNDRKSITDLLVVLQRQYKNWVLVRVIGPEGVEQFFFFVSGHEMYPPEGDTQN